MDLFIIFVALRRQWKTALAIMLTIFTGVAIKTKQSPYEFQSEMLILMDKGESVPVIDVRSPEQSTPQDLSTEIEILRSKPLVAKAISKIQQDYPDLGSPEKIEKVINKILIRQQKDANVLIVSYKDTSPEKTKAVLDALGITYVRYGSDRQKSQAGKAIEFIQEQLPAAQQSLDEVALKIQEFQQDYGIIEPETYATDIAKLQQDLAKQNQELEKSITRTQSQYEELRQQLQSIGQNPEIALSQSILSQDTVYQNLAKQLKEIESKYAMERTRLKDTHPSIEDLKLQRESVENLLENRAIELLGTTVSQVNLQQVSGYGENHQTTANQLVSQLLQSEMELVSQQRELESVKQAEAEVNNRFQQIPQLRQTYIELQRQFEVKANAVNHFLGKIQELEILESQEIATWEILEPSYLPEYPVSPNVKGNYVLGLVAGGIVGIALALILDRCDPKLKDIEELRQLTELPIIGMIPKVRKPSVIAKSRDNRLFRNYQYLAFTESLRSLVMTVGNLVCSPGKAKIIVVASTSHNEGKSTISYNLGVLMAELGHRVLVVDTDLRKPSIHHLAHQPNLAGISTILSEDQHWYNLVHTGTVKNLDVITSGPIYSSNPGVLLDSPKMKQLLDEWRNVYDYVLLDTPPITVTADAQSLGKNADSIIFVAALDRTNREPVSQALEILQRSKCSISGLVVNLVNIDYSTYQKTRIFNGPSTLINFKKNSEIVEQK